MSSLLQQKIKTNRIIYRKSPFCIYHLTFLGQSPICSRFIYLYHTQPPA